MTLLVYLLQFMFIAGFSQSIRSQSKFNNYWYQGKGEVSVYQLQQARYGKMHKGHVVMVFVTEDFSSSRQVKIEPEQGFESGQVRVLKLNSIKKFATGLYDYSLMNSVFTNVNNGEALKITHSTQDWCGQQFMQLNRRAGKFDYKLFSYFGAEGDQEKEVSSVLSEDELWNMIRLNPDHIPTGDIHVLPALSHVRLKHLILKPESAYLSMTATNEVSTLKLKYQTIDRILEIKFSSEFPHQILEWTEEYQSGWGKSKQRLKTISVLKESKMLEYWGLNDPADSYLRLEMGLD